jgi:phospholipid N-methyltransferase
MASPRLLLFFSEWLKRPCSVAAVIPSGKALARLITRSISGKTGPVLELGPGTGVFTNMLMERGVQAEDLTLIEYGARFATVLRESIPDAQVRQMDASALAHLPPLRGDGFGAVVCGLGLLSMPENKVRQIVGGAMKNLRPDGSLYLFTYSSRCSVSPPVLKQLGLRARRVGRAWMNFPPASVFEIRPVERRRA